MDSVYEIVKSLVNWYYANNCPNRQAIRDKKVKLPSGVEQNLVEAFLPILNKNSKEKINYKKQEDEKDERTIVVASDFHIPFVDKEVLALFTSFLYEFSPDELVLNGNINDCTSFSSHPKIRELGNAFTTGKEEREYWFSVAKCLRQALPESKIVYVGSQCHEGWIDKWASLSPILLADENYTTKNWFKLDEFGIDFVPEIYDPIGNKELIITHGTIARGKSGGSAMAEVEYSGTSIIQGHTHKLSQVYKTNEIGEYVGIECGCLCERKPWYVLKGKRRMMDWQQGFVIVNIKGNSFSTQLVPIIRDSKDKPYFWIGKKQYK